MKVLVTGAAGYIGSNLVLAMRERGLEVRAVDAFKDYYSPAIKRSNAACLAAKGVTVQEVDLAGDDLANLVEGCDGVVHLAGQPGLSSTTTWEAYNRNNVLATHRLLGASKGVNFFVNVSSSSVYGIHATDTEEVAAKPASWYGVTKLAAEQEAMASCRGNGVPACSLRFFSVYGERERPEKLFPKLIRAIANDEAFPLFEGSLQHKRSFTYVGDICEGIFATIEQWDRARGEIFNLGTDQCFTTGEGIAIVESIMGKKAKIEITPARAGDQMATHANIDKIRERLSWQPKTSLDEGLGKMVAWYMDEVHGKVDWK